MEKKQSPCFHIDEIMDKTKQVMKYLTLALLLFALYSYTDSYAQSTRLKLDLENATLLDMIKEIEQQSEFVFMYGDELLPILNGKQGDIKVKNETIDNILKQYFNSNSLKYFLNNRQVILKKNNSQQQQKRVIDEEEMQLEVSGTVTDELGPLAGASVFVKGTTIGVTTDFDGNYSIEVPDPDAILVFSFIGYTTLEVPVNSQTNIDIVLKEDAQALDEVVITAQGI